MLSFLVPHNTAAGQAWHSARRHCLRGTAWYRLLTVAAVATTPADRFRLDVALSLTQKNKRGGPEYVQVGAAAASLLLHRCCCGARCF